MPVLYYWRPENHHADTVDLDPRAWHGLHQNALRFGNLSEGERIWAFTRTNAGVYVLAASYRVMWVERGDFEYGRFRARAEPGTVQFFDVARGSDVAPLLRRFNLSIGGWPVGRYFQGPGAVRELSLAEDEALAAFAAMLPLSPSEASNSDDWRLVLRAAEKAVASAAEFTSPVRGSRYRIGDVEDERIVVSRITANAPAVLTPTRVTRAVAKVRSDPEGVVRGTLSSTVAEETAVVYLHPLLRWSADCSRILVDGDATEAPNPPERVYAEFGEGPNDDPAALQRFARKVRRGQPKFRERLLALYGGKCAVTGWAPENVLEAAHILLHATHGLNSSDNGILLRADLHALFDDGLMHIHPETLTVEIDDSLSGTPYAALHGTVLRDRRDGSRPRRDFLVKRRELAVPFRTPGR